MGGPDRDVHGTISSSSHSLQVHRETQKVQVIYNAQYRLSKSYKCSKYLGSGFAQNSFSLIHIFSSHRKIGIHIGILLIQAKRAILKRSQF